MQWKHIAINWFLCDCNGHAMGQNELRKKHVEAEALFSCFGNKNERERKNEDGEEEKNGTNCSLIVRRLSNTATEKKKKKQQQPYYLIDVHSYAVSSVWLQPRKKWLLHDILRWTSFKETIVETEEKKHNTPVWHLGGARRCTLYKYIECVPWLTAHEETKR